VKHGRLSVVVIEGIRLGASHAIEDYVFKLDVRDELHAKRR
jgi:hypothetical protein